jgi:integrase
MVARDMLRAKVPLQDIQDALGHASPATTQIYTKQIGGQRSAHEDALISVRGGATPTTPQDLQSAPTE